MTSLSSSLAIASQSLMAEQAEISVTNNNIANASTTGYSREQVELEESPNNGVDITGITSVQDELLNIQIQQQTSQQSSANAQVNALTQVEDLFPSTGTSLSSSLSTFFTSLTALSANPSNTASRETVISNAQTLVQQFNSISSGLTGPASALNTDVTTDVAQINQLSSEAASLNQQIVQQQSAGQPTATFTDQLNQLETQLAGLTNISITHTADGDTISTGNGTPLVLGSESYALQTNTDASGNTQVLDASGNNITTAITGGDLGGTIQVRDNDIPALQTSLDTLANQFATAFNSAQASGYDANGNPGAALFTVSSTVAGSAATISLTTTDPTAIAASSVAGSDASGSNGNVANLTAVQNAALPAGQSATGLASNLVYQVGSLTSTATAASSAASLSLTSLSNQQSSVSGVSIDQETANLLQYQQAYEAAAKVVSTISTLMTTLMNMIPSGS